MSEAVLLTFGRYKGQAIDLRSRRSIEIVAETDEDFVLDYFFYQGKFHRARIPKDCVGCVVGQRFNFSRPGIFGLSNPFLNHAQARFTLLRPIDLFPLHAPPTEENRLGSIDDFVYSIEVVGPKGKKWSWSRSFGDFAAAHRVLATHEVVFERAMVGGFEVIQSPPLRLSGKQKNQLLELVLRRSHDAGLREKYYLVTPFFGARNCTSQPFALLDGLLKREYRWHARLLSKIFWRFPINLRRYLILRGVIDPRVESTSMNDEFSWLIHSPEMKQRLAQLKG